MIVVDASIFVAAILDDEQNSVAELAHQMISDNEVEAVVPPIFYYETSNVFLQAMRRKRISQAIYKKYLQLLFDFPLIIDNEQSIIEAALIAEKYDLTVYDASYLETAVRGGYKLASLDKKLLSAAKMAKIDILKVN